MKKLPFFFFGLPTLRKVLCMLYVITVINILLLYNIVSPDCPKVIAGEDDMLDIVVDAVAEGDGSGFGKSG